MNIADIEVIINVVNRGRHYSEGAVCRPCKSIRSVVAKHGPDPGFDRVDWVVVALESPSPRDVE